jgi:hypothetical protein
VMAGRGLKRLCFLIGLVAILGGFAYPTVWRYAAYKSLKQVIATGSENAAIREVQRLSNNPFFDPDWTIDGAIPRSRWLRDLDLRIFGCPTCRGNWRPFLHQAASRGHSQLVNLLLAKGASFELSGDRGCQVLQAAAIAGDTNIIATLIAKGADVNATNFFGSPLHAATGYTRKPEAITFLISAGADLNAVTPNGWTPLDFATVWNTQAIPLLSAKGAVPGTNRRVGLPKNQGGRDIADRVVSANQAAF